ncbi:MAG: UDP-N-acetylmuramoyl-L-alanine--D-glutamate ligase [Sphingomonadales bacterium]|nr:UDP-N-acetylmuramoyl-L-alanine--D-glutamate ligase [Sphingomonadales bacterium]
MFGLARSGIATGAALASGGADVVCWDDGEAGRAAAHKAGLPVADLATADWRQFAALVLAPGVPLTHPQPHWTVRKAQGAGIEIIGDIELFFRERAKAAPESPVVAVTGTNGKSTTTALIAHILRAAGRAVQMGGNIGTAILLLEPPTRERFHVIEMSSFQIDLTPSLAPTAGVLLNISPDHLDRHGTLEHYAAIKERLVMAADVSFVGIDDDMARAMEVRRLNTGLPHFPVSQGAFEWGFYADGTEIYFRDLGGDVAERVADLSGIATLRGSHNAQNAAAAVGVASWFRVPAPVIAGALKTFPGLPHRLEEVGRIGRVLFINDSKATNADSTEKALASFPRDIFWIAGGLPKEGGIASLASYFPRVARAYLIGQAADEFAETLEGKIAFERSGTLETAVEHAARDAAQRAGAEPVVLLSPACASYDQFKSFEHRGDRFRELVGALVVQGARA